MLTNGRYQDAASFEGEIASPGSLPRTESNVGEVERWASVLAGAALVTGGLLRGNWRGTLAALAGGGLVLRGLTGRCLGYELLGISTSQAPSKCAVDRLQHSVAQEALATVDGDAIGQASFDSFPASDPPAH